MGAICAPSVLLPENYPPPRRFMNATQNMNFPFNRSQGKTDRSIHVMSYNILADQLCHHNSAQFNTSAAICDFNFRGPRIIEEIS